MGRVQFILFRISFGIYLAYEFLIFIQSSHGIFHPQGIFAASGISTGFPNLFLLSGNAYWAKALLLGFAVLSLLFAAGICRRIIALVLWYGWACVVNRVPIITVPSEGFIGWMLLCCALIPPREDSKAWQAPKELMPCAWIVVGLAYSVSGLNKMESVSWSNGTALRYVFENPIARPTFILPHLQQLSDTAIWYLTKSALWLEILFAPLCLLSATRFLVWTAMVALHLTVLAFLDITEVSLGMLLVHFFIFESRWLSGSLLGRAIAK